MPIPTIITTHYLREQDMTIARTQSDAMTANGNQDMAMVMREQDLIAAYELAVETDGNQTIADIFVTAAMACRHGKPDWRECAECILELEG